MDATGQSKIEKVVCIGDPAVRWSPDPKPGFTGGHDYARTRDFTSVTVIEGERAMVFHTRRLRRMEIRDVEAAGGDVYRRENAFALGVVQVDMPDGTTFRPARDRWTDAELDKFEFAVIEDVGAYVQQRARVPFALSGYYVPPPSSVAALAACLYLSAVRSPVVAPDDKSKSEAP